MNFSYKIYQGLCYSLLAHPGEDVMNQDADWASGYHYQPSEKKQTQDTSNMHGTNAPGNFSLWWGLVYVFVWLGCNGKQAVGSEVLLIKLLCSFIFYLIFFLFFCSHWIFFRSDIPSNITGSYKAESGILKTSTTFCRGERKPRQNMKLLCVCKLQVFLDSFD